jgi:hypothetical protein
LDSRYLRQTRLRFVESGQVQLTIEEWQNLRIERNNHLEAIFGLYIASATDAKA